MTSPPAGAAGGLRSGRWAIADMLERFLAEPDEPLPDVVRPVVAESWRRSLRLGVDPAVAGPPLALGPEELDAYRGAHPLAAMMPLIRSLLVEDAEEAGHIVAVGDAEGRLLWVDGHRGLRTRAEGMSFVEGALWSEGGAGTNAPGTALALNTPVRIAAPEHFGLNVHAWSCVAAPVHDPVTGQLLGVIDLTGRPDLAGPRTLALVRACATAVESHQALLRQRRPQESNGSPPLRAVPGIRVARTRPAADGGDLRILGTDEAVIRLPGHTLGVALSPRHSELVWLLARAPRGLSAQALDAALNERGGQLVTVRAELVRLRRVLGDGVLASRPYRFTVPIATDADELSRLLARGAVLRALDLFTGPPLPGSEAPAVRALRDEVVAELRAGVLRSRSVAALERWIDTESGRDDDEAWQLLERLLPYGSPKRARVRVHRKRLATLLQPSRA